MRRAPRLTSLTVAFVLLGSFAMSEPGRAELELASYIELTIERLELIRAAWTDTGAPPTEAQLSELYESYGVDSQRYLRYGGKKREEIQRFLDEHDEERDVIESLSAAIHALIEGKEPE